MSDNTGHVVVLPEPLSVSIGVVDGERARRIADILAGPRTPLPGPPVPRQPQGPPARAVAPGQAGTEGAEVVNEHRCDLPGFTPSCPDVTAEWTCDCGRAWWYVAPNQWTARATPRSPIDTSWLRGGPVSVGQQAVIGPDEAIVTPVLTEQELNRRTRRARRWWWAGIGAFAVGAGLNTLGLPGMFLTLPGLAMVLRGYRDESWVVGYRAGRNAPTTVEG